MRDEYDGLGPARQVFWETLEGCYNVVTIGDSRYPNTLNALVDSAQPLMGLPLPKDEHLREYPLKYADRLTGSERLLYDFSGKVYPAKREGKVLEELSLIDRGKFSEFHNPARGALARFWNRWFELAYVGREIGVDTIVEMFGGQYRLVKLLTYLETALVQWTQDAGMPKRWLFRAARDWARVVPKT